MLDNVAMLGRVRAGWRWLAAFAIVLLVTLELRRGLTTTATLVQVLSVITIIGGLLTAAKAQRDSPGRMVSRDVDLPKLLRDIAKAHRIRRSQIRAALIGWDVDGFLDGIRPLRWDFVKAFLEVVAAGDHNVREALEFLVRPAWDAVRQQRGGDVSGGAVVLVTPVTGGWVGTIERAAEASEAITRLDRSAGQLESWRTALVFTLGKYSDTIHTLMTERDQLIAEMSAQVSRKDAELHDVRQRLERAEERRKRTYKQLRQTERMLEDARKLRDEATSQAAVFQKRLARLERRPDLALPGSPGIEDSGPYTPMGAIDQQLGEAILHRTEKFLNEQ